MALSPVFRHASSTPPPSAGACARPPPGPAASWWWRPGTSPAGRVTADEARLPAAGDRPRCPGPAPEGCAPARRQPVPGRGPVEVSGVAGYFRYFGSRAAAPIKTWYSFRLGSWHLVALNSNCQAIDARPRRPGSAPNWCSTAMTTTTSASAPGSAWPTRSGQRPARVRGRHRRRTVVATPDSGSRQPDPYDQDVRVLRLTLKPGGYRRRLVYADGLPFRDRGTGTCH